MAHTTGNLPEKLTLKIEYTITPEELEEYFEIPAETITLELMIRKLRDYAADDIDSNTVEDAKVYDENGTVVSWDE